jgi:hypothetical protein
MVLVEMQGFEFDWFARDDAGEYAVFATAGSGPVPEEVADACMQHRAIGEQIAVTGWGTSEVWKSFSNVGLFAYDWDDQRRCYARMAVPDRPVDAALSARLVEIVLPTLPLSFGERPIILASTNPL